MVLDDCEAMFTETAAATIISSRQVLDAVHTHIGRKGLVLREVETCLRHIMRLSMRIPGRFRAVIANKEQLFQKLGLFGSIHSNSAKYIDRILELTVPKVTRITDNLHRLKGGTRLAQACKTIHRIIRTLEVKFAQRGEQVLGVPQLQLTVPIQDFRSDLQHLH